MAGTASGRLARAAAALSAVILLPAAGAGLWLLTHSQDGHVLPAGGWPAVADSRLAALRVAEKREAVSLADSEASARRHPAHQCLTVRQWLLAVHSQLQTRLAGECRLEGGRWTGAFTGRPVADARLLETAPVIPLAEAAAAGLRGADLRRWLQPAEADAWLWMPVLRRAARARGQRGFAEWRPPRRDLACAYARRWLAAKARFRLTVTEDERLALATVLSGCGRVGENSDRAGRPVLSQSGAVSPVGALSAG